MYACEFGCGYLSSSYNQVVQHEQECHAAAPGVSQQRPFVEYTGTRARIHERGYLGVHPA